ncbi:MAG: hypothetical protein K8H88_06890 [Sandaracinaceae bacterium]|nr:hypothetical protein [Sandaracinaceae bacterium]
MAKKKTPTRKPAGAKKPSRPAKKTASQAAKKAAKKPAAAAIAPKKKSAKRAAVPDVLSIDERAKLLKPRTEFLDVLGRVTREWQAYRALRVPGLSAAKLESFGKKAALAAEKEARLEEAMMRKLVPLQDARRIAHDAAYRALLDTHAAIKLHARLDPGIVERFSYLADLVRNQSSGGDEPPPSPTGPTG